MNGPVKERLDVDPRFRGVWHVKAFSFDDWETFHENTDEEPFCRVFATKVRTQGADGDWRDMTVNRVVSFLNDYNRVSNALFFLNSPLIWFVTDVSNVLAGGVTLKVMNSQEEGGFIFAALCVVEV